MMRVWPVISEAAGEARKATAPETSLRLADAVKRGDALDDVGLELGIGERGGGAGGREEGGGDGVDA